METAISKFLCYLSSFLGYIGSRTIGIQINVVIKTFYSHFENFLLVMLCKYDLGAIQFAVAKWFFCILLCNCCLESWYGLWTFLDDCMPPAVSTLDSVAKELKVISYSTRDLGCSAETTHDFFNNEQSTPAQDNAFLTENRIPRRPYVSAFAFALLYGGIIIARSGG